MKRFYEVFYICFFLIIFFILFVSGSNIKNIKEKENKKNLSKSSTTFAEIPLGDIKVFINYFSEKKKKDKDFKSLEIYRDNECLFMNKIYLPDNNSLFSFTKNENRIGFYLKFLESPISRYVIISNEYPYYKEIPIKDNWVSSSVIIGDYVIYSTEFSDNTVKKINISTGEISEYDGWYPNVDLFYTDEKEILAVFKYDNQYYEISNNLIRQSTIDYILPKSSFSDFKISN